jgi:hypothetical protein
VFLRPGIGHEHIKNNSTVRAGKKKYKNKHGYSLLIFEQLLVFLVPSSLLCKDQQHFTPECTPAIALLTALEEETRDEGEVGVQAL